MLARTKKVDCKTCIAFIKSVQYLRLMLQHLDIPVTLLITAILAFAMLCPLEAPPPAPKGSDKFIHLIAFAALSFPLSITGRLGLLPIFILASVFGGIIELVQPRFNRSADLHDWIADIFGVGLGIVFGLLYRQLRNN